MPLRRVRIDNFRGIPRVEIEVDDLTVLIGENGSGRSSLFRALTLCLGTEATSGRLEFTPDDLRRAPGGVSGPLWIELEFRERERGDWQFAPKDPLRAHAWAGKDGRHRLVVVVTAKAGRGGAITSTIRFRGANGALTKAGSDAAALQALRRRFPALHIRRGILTASWIAGPAKRPSTGREAKWALALLEALHRLGSGLEDPHPRELAAAMAGAQAILAGVEQQLGAPESLPRWLATELGLVKIAGVRATPSIRATHPGSARSLGAILAAGTLLAARGPQQLAHGAEAILVVEDPEAHLHPMTLAMAWQLLERVPAQKLFGTMSAELLAEFPLAALRRLVPARDRLIVHQVGRRTLTPPELRKVRYHVRSRRAGAMFARCWLLVEGESEFWLLPHLARHAGADFQLEGIALVEFAQCGIAPLVKLARDLGIEWHLLCDGDVAGRSYAAAARAFARGAEAEQRITMLPARDLEHLLYDEGFADVFQQVASLPRAAKRRPRKAGAVIRRALTRSAKPELALSILEAAVGRADHSIPPTLQKMFATLTDLARRAELPLESG